MKKNIDIEIKNINIDIETKTFSIDYKIDVDGSFYKEDLYQSDFSGYNTVNDFEKVLKDGWAFQIILEELEF